jgi:aminopeptidase YwaD
VSCRRLRPAWLFALIVGLALCTALDSRAAGPVAVPGAAELSATLAALTTQEMEGRGSGTAGGDRAARYLADRLAEGGFAPGGDAGTYFQWFPVGSTPRAAAGTALEIVGSASRALALGRDWTPYGGSPAGDVAADVVFVGYGRAAPDGGPGDFAGARDAIALALDGGAPGAGSAPSRLEKLIAARRHGAAALLIAGDALPPLEATSTPVRLVSASVTRAAADALLAPAGQSLARLASARSAGGLSTGIRVRLSVRIDREERRTANVIGILPGADPALASEAVVIGAHYDHLGRVGGVVHPGADDNASGTAVVLGMARALASAGGLARTLVVAFFSGEEIGLLGSAHYTGHAPVPIERTVAMLNFDMVGRMRGDRLTVGGVDSGSGLRAIVDAVKSGDKLDLALGDSPYGPSDHASFYAAGVPVLFFHTGGHDDYHAPGDTADKINAPGMSEVARVGLRIVERIGGAPRPAYVALTRPEGLSRAATSRGGDSGGAFLGVSVDGRSESDGVRIGSVITGSGAERAGLRGGDVIVRIAGAGVNRFEDLRRALAGRRPGDQVALVYLRDGEDHQASAMLGARP